MELLEFWKNVPEFWQGVSASIVAAIIMSSTLYLSGIAGKAANSLKKQYSEYTKNMASGILCQEKRANMLLQSYTSVAVNFANSIWQMLLAIFSIEFIGSFSFIFLLFGFYFFIKSIRSLNLLHKIIKVLPEIDKEINRRVNAKIKTNIHYFTEEGKKQS